MGWYCGAGVFGLIGCISLCPSLALLTFFNNNDNNVVYLQIKMHLATIRNSDSYANASSSLYVTTAVMPTHPRHYTWQRQLCQRILATIRDNDSYANASSPHYVTTTVLPTRPRHYTWQRQYCQRVRTTMHGNDSTANRVSSGHTSKHSCNYKVAADR